ncbi:hypothetical protein QOZ80_8BG0656540 [Eleusine coracana subsp. coracana]|nr:hypothetical protein QOZ80_8BG0656540 [Eleusine coracana subsp. coracana]
MATVVTLLHRDLERGTHLPRFLPRPMQEVLEASKKQEVRRYDPSPSRRSSKRTGFPLPAPPGKVATAAVPTPRVDDKRGVESTCPGPMEDRFTALRAYRRSKNLCTRCGEKWFKEHKCPASVQLQVVEDMLEFLANQEEFPVITENEQSQPEEEADLCAISREALEGKDGPRTIKLQGRIQKTQVLMLIDSGSTHSFVSSSCAAQLTGVAVADKVLRVKIADGGVLKCDKEIKGRKWLIQGVEFCPDLKVLELGCYHVILGMDWLERHSPMTVHWGHKIMSFYVGHNLVTLKGVHHTEEIGNMISAAELWSMVSHRYPE